MTRSKFLITANASLIELDLSDIELASCFDDPSSWLDFTLQQTNVERIWDPWLRGRQGMTIVDIGANIGLFALHVSDCAERVICVEPTPEHCDLLNRLTAKYPQISTVQAALHSDNCEVPLFINCDNTQMHSTVNTYGECVRVRGVRLNTLLKELNLDRVDLCKIDIEGAETVALTAAMFNSCRGIVRAYYIESHETAAYPRDEVRNRLVKQLTTAGYNVELNRHDALYAYQ